VSKNHQEFEELLKQRYEYSTACKFYLISPELSDNENSAPLSNCSFSNNNKLLTNRGDNINQKKVRAAFRQPVQANL
jgi:hypothetical protein